MTLPRCIRYPLGLLLMVGGVLAFLYVPFGGVYMKGGTIAAGFCLLAFGPSDAEKRGYRF